MFFSPLSDLGVLGNLGEVGRIDVIAVEGFERQIRTLEQDNIELQSKLQGKLFVRVSKCVGVYI